MYNNVMNFDDGVNRINTNSVKYDKYKENFNTDKDDIIPMWIADMDFKTCDEITKALQTKLITGNLGYDTVNGYYEAVEDWMKKRHGLKITKEDIVYTPGVVTAINFLLKILVKENDKVLVQSPVYHSFFRVLNENNCDIVQSELELNNNRYEINFEEFERQISTGVKVFILCNPHNPVGRVWEKEELERLVEICESYKVFIISDEIHSDLIFKGYKHNSLTTVSPYYKDNIVTLTAPSKTFNLAGLYTSNVIITNEKIRKKYKDLFSTDPNVLGAVALIAAYTKGEKWLEELLVYIENNYNYVNDYISKNIPKIKVTKQEGTFLTWLDCRELRLSDEDLDRFFIDKAKLALSSGAVFGNGGSGFMRMNIGCPLNTIKEALCRLKIAVEDIC
ncbi:cystathionine beta-lyase PatB [[Clostridium] sordellii]|uniref:MalY/PatB family protein n=1 Tax=Paraclostridium sordellii TaxID=1505 RepID=UPI0005E01D72|nr:MULTISPECIES: MalY/PatB family protein [Paeniclostridium]MBW4863679.1 pyridoxal phosphate-dependent aminotransferase [Paeniclostridium sp.]MBW4874507.1 pyridoxal phosphate-dependent aminotransferase [Paeniclostridium sp.]MBX9181677.1 pyridoxal phosphate-dependent aminotransferase [Paeniclostridium sordellii]MDU1454853.1 MalY/PatB family protein [Paeniclostridium sordellii]CEO04932.1 cystathionine beta-lyase PatB [[Clostridium] sordellii] [Paeniclostridium sordellii]